MRFLLSASLLLSLVAFTGCENKPKDGGKKDSHSHSHDSKEKYDSPAAELKGVIGKAVASVQAIRDAGEKGDWDAAHGELHHIGDYLESLPKIAAAASLDAAQTEKLTKVTQSLFDIMSKIDGSLHGGEAFKFADAKEALDRDVADLKSIADSVGK